MVGLVGERCLRVNTIDGSTTYIKDLIKNENCIQVHPFNTMTLKLNNEVCVFCGLRILAFIMLKTINRIFLDAKNGKEDPMVSNVWICLS